MFEVIASTADIGKQLPVGSLEGYIESLARKALGDPKKWGKVHLTFEGMPNNLRENGKKLALPLRRSILPVKI